MLFTSRPTWASVGLCAVSLTGWVHAAVVTTSPPEAAAASWSCHTHVALAGDTLIGLGQRYLVRPLDWPVLARLNHVGNPRRIPVGTRLCVPWERMRATPSPVQVLEAIGDASTRPGERLLPGQRVRTGGQGYITLQLADGSVLKVQSDTEAVLQSSQSHEAAGVLRTLWQLLRGRIESVVTRQPAAPPRFQIQTPQATLAVRGTEFRVTARPDQTLAETLSGAVAVQQGRRQALVSAGLGTVATAHGELEAPRTLPTPPDIGQVPTLFERPLVRLPLPSLAEGQRYRVQVADDADFRRVRAETDSAEPLVRIADLADGSYHWRVRTSDASGLSGADATGQFRLKARPEPPIPTAPLGGAKLRTPNIAFAWAEHPQASHYLLQVGREGGFDDLAVDQAHLTQPGFSVALPPGDYVWRVRTALAGPDLGPWGDAQRLAVRAPLAALPPPVVSDTTLLFQPQGEPGQRFEFQLARDADFHTLVAEASTPAAESPAPVALPRPEEGGRLYVRYRAIDPDGYVGPHSGAQIIELPACLRSGSGACVRSGQGQPVQTQPRP